MAFVLTRDRAWDRIGAIMRWLLSLAAVTFTLQSSSFAQTAPPAAPPTGRALPAGDVSAKEVKAFIDALPKDAISDRPIRGFDTGGSRVTVYGVFRPKALPGDAILHETRTSETYYILEGFGTL